MNLARTLSLALALFAVAAPGWAAQDDQHKAHHPAGSGKATPEMGGMAKQRKAMQEMHDKMMGAKTPEERNALMPGHMKAMREGMGMMKGMGGMASPPNMTERQTMMEQRMDMMQTMMEMMVERLPQTPDKP